MYKSKITSLCLIMLAAFSLNAHAKLYKWVDDQGITHYGEIVPPEYANKDRDSLRKSGGLEKKPEKITPEMQQARDEEAQRKNLANKEALEQARRDSALLNTFSNEKEIDQARDRSLVLVNARIESNTMLLKSAQASLDGHKKEAESRTKAGKKIPQSLTDDISESETRVEKYKTELRKSEEELIAVKSRFERDKSLYRSLKGIPASQ